MFSSLTLFPSEVHKPLPGPVAAPLALCCLLAGRGPGRLAAPGPLSFTAQPLLLTLATAQTGSQAEGRTHLRT